MCFHVGGSTELSLFHWLVISLLHAMWWAPQNFYSWSWGKCVVYHYNPPSSPRSRLVAKGVYTITFKTKPQMPWLLIEFGPRALNVLQWQEVCWDSHYSVGWVICCMPCGELCKSPTLEHVLDARNDKKYLVGCGHTLYTFFILKLLAFGTMGGIGMLIRE